MASASSSFSDTTSLDTPVLISDLRDVTVQARFTSPAEDMLVKRVDLMAELIKHPQASCLLRVRGLAGSVKKAPVLLRRERLV